MDKQKMKLAAFATVSGFVFIGLLGFLYSTYSDMSRAKDSRDEAADRLNSIYRSPIFPNQANIKQFGDDTLHAQAWIDSVLVRIKEGEITVPEGETPSGFKQRLQDTVRMLSENEAKKPTVADGFAFGFDRYLAVQGGLMPDQVNVPRLAWQLEVIKQVSEIAIRSGVTKIIRVVRNEFDVKEGEEANNEEPTGSRRSRRNRDDNQGPKNAVVTAESVPSVLKGMITASSFTFDFETRPAALFEVFTQVSAMKTFAVISDFKIAINPNADIAIRYDQLMAKTQQQLSVLGRVAARDKKDSKEKATELGPMDLSLNAIPVAQRLLTDSERELPLTVTLQITVYSLEATQ